MENQAGSQTFEAFGQLINFGFWDPQHIVELCTHLFTVLLGTDAHLTWKVGFGFIIILQMDGQLQQQMKST